MDIKQPTDEEIEIVGAGNVSDAILQTSTDEIQEELDNLESFRNNRREMAIDAFGDY